MSEAVEKIQGVLSKRSALESMIVSQKKLSMDLERLVHAGDHRRMYVGVENSCTCRLSQDGVSKIIELINADTAKHQKELDAIDLKISAIDAIMSPQVTS
jgi:hypothetical protein